LAAVVPTISARFIHSCNVMA